MAILLCKPKGVQLLQKETEFEMVFERPYYLTFAYSDGEKVHIEKHKDSDMKEVWKKLESLTDNAVIAFFEHKRRKIFEKYGDNVPPTRLNDSLAYIGVGTVLNLVKSLRKKYYGSYFYKQFKFDGLLKMDANIFFSHPMCWFLEKVMSEKSAMAFLRADGTISIVNMSNFETFKDMLYFDTVLISKKKKKSYFSEL